MAQNPGTQPFVSPGIQLTDFLRTFWQRQIDTAEGLVDDGWVFLRSIALLVFIENERNSGPSAALHGGIHPALPLARIKKVMKSDPDVKVRREPWSLRTELTCLYR